MDKRIVITGIGAITPLGHTIEETWSQVLAGKSGVGPITLFDITDYEVRIAAEVKEFDPATYMDRRETKRTDRFTQFAIAASKMALKNAGLEINSENSVRIGVLLGSGVGGIGTVEAQHKILMERGPSRVSPLVVPMMISDMASGYVSILTGARGPNSTVVTACATGANAIGDAAEMIRRGIADAMIVGGAEAAITPLSVAGFTNAGAMTKKFNDNPEKASRPFDTQRDGFVMGEGAAVLILESEEHAKARGATILAEVAGYGMAGDAYHITSPIPSGEGVARAIKMALAQAGETPETVDYVNGHATSTPLGDAAEFAAYKLAFGEQATKIPVSSTKGATGHMLGAAGAIEAIFGILAIRDGVLPPCANFEQADEDNTLNLIVGEPQKKDVRVVVSNNSGFGGHNAVLVLRKYEA